MSDWLDAEGHADRALEMFERGRWAEAEAELRKAIALNPDQAEWHYNLGLTLEAAGRDGDALACFQRTAEMMPDEVEPLIAAGNAALRLGRAEAALAWVDRALALDRGSESAHAARIECLVRLERHEEAETAFYLAQQSLEDPSPACLSAVARALIEGEQWDRAAWCLREALRLDPSLPRLRSNLAFVLAAKGQRQRAVQLYLRELREDPGSVDTLLDYGELLVDLGRLSEAGEKFRRVLELEPANVEAHERLGWIAFEHGHFERAHLEYELVLKLDPEFPNIRLALAETLLRRGLEAEARRALRAELDLWLDATPAPDRTLDPAERFASILLEAGMAVESARLLDRVDAGRADAPGLLRLLALSRFRSGDIDGGAAAARRVIRLQPDCVRSMHNMALAALEAHQLSLAAGWVHRGLCIDRHDTGLRRLRMRLYLAVIRRRLGRLVGRVAARKASSTGSTGAGRSAAAGLRSSSAGAAVGSPRRTDARSK